MSEVRTGRAMRRAIGVAIAALALALPASAQASTSMQWGGQDWHVYDGTGLLGQAWSPSRVSVGARHGYLHLHVADGESGGVSLLTSATTGSWSVTFRMTAGPGKYAILLWPASGARPELDFAEDRLSDANRRLMTASYHPEPGWSHSLRADAPGDFTAWHTASVTVGPILANVYLDGVRLTAFPSPGVPMRLAIQTAEEAGSVGSSTLVVRRVSAP